MLRGYIGSGWAFFIPYLSIYLLYHYYRWPANPIGWGESVARGPEGGGASFVLPLIYVYWVLHGLHAILAGVALRSWWKTERKKQTCLPGTAHQSRARVLNATLKAVFPWALLATIFYLPGAYLEWPADPWEHVRRITEWGALPNVGAHSAGYKSFYFFTYSIARLWPSGSLLSCLDIYYSGLSLLLAWQYYLLGRSIGLKPRWAFLFIIVNLLTAGNSCFSFYRYYGLASTLVAHLAVIAFTRIAAEAAAVLQLGKSAQPASPMSRRLESSAGHIWLAGQFICLTGLIAFNHVQGIGIAVLSVAAIAFWRLDFVRWRVALLLVGLSVSTVLWYPRHPAVDTSYRISGWLNSWYGFNLFAWPSPAADRAMDILGIIGLCNVAAGAYLLSRRHIAGWLTVTPIALLALPCSAIPIASAIAAGPEGADYINAYHRMLFAVPVGLALVVIAQQTNWTIAPRFLFRSRFFSPPFTSLIVASAIFIILPPDRHVFNRVWHVLAQTPASLSLHELWKDTTIIDQRLVSDNRYIAGTVAVVHVMAVQHPSYEYVPGKGVVNGASIHYGPRFYSNAGRSPVDDIDLIHLALAEPAGGARPAIFVLSPVTFAARSQAALASGHWAAYDTVLVSAGAPELKCLARKYGYVTSAGNVDLEIRPPPRHRQ